MLEATILSITLILPRRSNNYGKFENSRYFNILLVRNFQNFPHIVHYDLGLQLFNKMKLPSIVYLHA